MFEIYLLDTNVFCCVHLINLNQGGLNSILVRKLCDMVGCIIGYVIDRNIKISCTV